MKLTTHELAALSTFLVSWPDDFSFIDILKALEGQNDFLNCDDITFDCVFDGIECVDIGDLIDELHGRLCRNFEVKK